MKRSTLFLGFTLVVLAGALSALWLALGPRPSAPPQPKVAEKPAEPPPAPVARTEPPPPPQPGVRSVYPGAGPSVARAPQPDNAPPAIRPPPAAPPPAPVPPPAAPPTTGEPGRTADLEPPTSVAPVPAVPPSDENAPPVDPDAVDLNTAPLEALNALGAGMVGKAIIANRPYASPDELVTRRVLKRQDFEAIKPRVVVRQQ